MGEPTNREAVLKKLTLTLSVLGAVQLGFLTGEAQAAAGPPEDIAPPPTSDLFEPFNQAMFSLNLTLDEYLARPVANGYAAVVPLGARQGVDLFFHNINIVPRVGNKLLQLKFVGAGTELTRFLINTTVGGLGFLTSRTTGLDSRPAMPTLDKPLQNMAWPRGPYLVLPFLGPSTVRNAIGLGVDGGMQPVNYLLPTIPKHLSARGGWLIGAAVNMRSLNLELFESVDRFSLDLYGAAQDGYLQQRERVVQDALPGISGR